MWKKMTRPMNRFRLAALFRCIWYILVVFMVTEFLVLNFAFFYAVTYISNELSQMKSPYRHASLFEKMYNNDKIRNAINAGKEGGFISIIQQTLERLYIVHEESEKTMPWSDKDGKKMKAISFLGLDVSHSGESSYLYKRILARKSFPYNFLIIDIGANDGLISSNSFNFIQWGWDAILVEPQADYIKLAKNNIDNYIDPGRKPPQKIQFVQAVVGDKDGHVDFVRKPQTFGTESHIFSESKELQDGDYTVTVPSITVKTLAKRYDIPVNFGILSIDAEGFGAQILHNFIESGYRPAYLVFERIHQQEAIQVTIRFLMDYHYHFIDNRGWNLIFEHQPPIPKEKKIFAPKEKEM